MVVYGLRSRHRLPSLCSSTHRLPFYGAASIESICWALEAGPHWGKLHTQRAQSLADRYPRYEQAVALRRELDPDGVC